MSKDKITSSMPVTPSDDPLDTMYEISSVVAAIGALLQGQQSSDALSTRDGRPMRGLSIILENASDLLCQTSEKMEFDRRQSKGWFEHMASSETREFSQMMLTQNRFVLKAVMEKLKQNESCSGSEKTEPSNLFADIENHAKKMQMNEENIIKAFEDDAIEDTIPSAKVDSASGLAKTAFG